LENTDEEKSSRSNSKKSRLEQMLDDFIKENVIYKDEKDLK